MAQKTRGQIQTEINNEVVSNNDRGITAQMLNTIFTDLNDSSINTLSDGSTFGLYQFDVSKNYNLNQGVIYNNQIYKANQAVSAGTFSVPQWDLVTREKKCVLNLIGNTNNNPTVYQRFNNLFTTTPTVTRLSQGVFQVVCPTNVFGGTSQFAIQYESWDNSQGLPAFPVSQNVPIGSPGNTFEIVVWNYTIALTDLYKGYLTITQYT
jgi:hypothetical protein